MVHVGYFKKRYVVLDDGLIERFKRLDTLNKRLQYYTNLDIPFTFLYNRLIVFYADRTCYDSATGKLELRPDLINDVGIDFANHIVADVGYKYFRGAKVLVFLNTRKKTDENTIRRSNPSETGYYFPKECNFMEVKKIGIAMKNLKNKMKE